jgi:hypothetical protein
MKTRANDRLIDDLLGSYIDWRERSERAETAYRRWSLAEPRESTVRFAEYSAAVDDEEASANRYAQLVGQVSKAKSADREARSGVDPPASTRV